MVIPEPYAVETVPNCPMATSVAPVPTAIAPELTPSGMESDPSQYSCYSTGAIVGTGSVVECVTSYLESPTVATTPTPVTGCMTVQSTAGGIKTDYNMLYSSVIEFCNSFSIGEETYFTPNTSKNIEDQMLDMFYSAKGQFDSTNVSNQVGVPQLTGEGIRQDCAVGIAAAAGICALIAVGVECAREGGEAFGKWIDDGGLSEIVNSLDSWSDKMFVDLSVASMGIMMGVAYLFGKDTANPWDVEDKTPELSCSSSQPFYEYDPINNDNHFPGGGSGSEFGKWFLRLGAASNLYKEYNDITENSK